MRNLIRKIDRRYQFSRPGSVLILVVALLVLMALIGTAFLNTQRSDRYNTVAHTNNTEIDLLVEGVKNMAKSTIVGGLNDPSLPFPYRPANSTLAKSWDAYDLFHQYTDNPLITTTANDAWLSPRCPVYLSNQVVPQANTGVVWPCIGEPLTGNMFESPFVLNNGALASGVALTYHDRVSYGFVPGTQTVTGSAANSTPGNPLTPTFATISYPDGTSATYPAFTFGTYTYLAGDADGDGIADCGMFKLPIGQVNGITYYAGVRIIDNNSAVNVNTAMSRRFDFNGPDASNDPIGPTRSVNGTAVTWKGIFNLGCFESNVGLAELLQTYNGAYPSASANPATTGLGSEFGAWLYYHLGNQFAVSAVPSNTSPSSGSVEVAGSAANPIPSEGDVIGVAGQSATSYPVADYSGALTQFKGFGFTTLGDMLTNQVARRPTNPGYTTAGVQCLAATDSDAASLAYHFVFENPNATPSIVEQILHSSLLDSAPNGDAKPPSQAGNTNTGSLSFASLYADGAYAGIGSTSYAGNTSNGSFVVDAWYDDNFDWKGELSAAPESCMTSANSVAATAGASFLPRRSIFTADSATSNLVPRPLLPTTTPSNYVAGPQTVLTSDTAQASSSNPSYTVWSGYPNAGASVPSQGQVWPSGMSPINSTLCKASINNAPFADLWRGFWLSMVGDGGLSPLGTNTDSTMTSAAYPNGYPIGSDGATPLFDHDLVQGQSIYTGMQFFNVGDLSGPTSDSSPIKPNLQLFQATGAQHPQAMLRSTLRDPNGVYYNYNSGETTNPPTPSQPSVSLPRNDSYIEADQMVLLRSAIAAANAEAMRDPVKTGTGLLIHAHDIPLTARVAGKLQTVYARIFGVAEQPYITKVYVNTDVTTTPGNTMPYVAIQLYNPYNTAIDLTGWQLSTVDRDPTAAGTLRNLKPIFNFNGQIIKPGGYALLEDFNAPGSGNVTVRPQSATNGVPNSAAYIQTTTSNEPITDIYVQPLETLINVYSSPQNYSNEELMLMRPAYLNEPTDEVPVDSYDFTGLSYKRMDPSLNQTVADEWYYTRANQFSPDGSINSIWRFIYPGRYDASDPTPYSAPTGATAPPVVRPTSSEGPPTPIPGTSSVQNEPRTPTPPPEYTTFSRRQQGTEAAYFLPPLLSPVNDPFQSYADIGEGASKATYPITFPFQYLNNDEPGPSPMPTTNPSGGSNFAPFGQFARNSDMLQIPFVGSYIIFGSEPTGFPVGTPISGVVPPVTPLTTTDITNIVELNPMPMDCAFAEDTDVSDDPPTNETTTSGGSAPNNVYIWNEAVGHFSPIKTTSSDNSVRSNNSPNPAFPYNLNFPAGQTIVDADPTLGYTSSNPWQANSSPSIDPFAPYKVQYNAPIATGASTVPTPAPPYDPGTEEYWRYRWASRIFDYLTVQSPNDDYLPNVQQNTYLAATGSYSLPVQNTAAISPAADTTYVPTNANGTSNPAVPPNYYAEDSVPVYGLININTAPWRVLSALRFCGYDDAETASSQIYAGIPDNVTLAQAIVNWRDGLGIVAPQSATASQVSSSGYPTTPVFPYTGYKGPFTSVSDLLNVPQMQTYLNNCLINSGTTIQKSANGPDAVQGILSPYNFYTEPASASVLHTSMVRNDVEERYDLLDRLSNQITTKSDVYTVYIVIQGWRNAGSTSSSNPPQLVTQRRAAFIIDRTGVTPTSSNVKTINVPTD
jgi:hypothetical protein